MKCGDIERLEDGVHLGGAVKDILIVNIDLGVEVKPGEISCEVIRCKINHIKNSPQST